MMAAPTLATLPTGYSVSQLATKLIEDRAAPSTVMALLGCELATACVRDNRPVSEALRRQMPAIEAYLGAHPLPEPRATADVIELRPDKSQNFRTTRAPRLRRVSGAATAVARGDPPRPIDSCEARAAVERELRGAPQAAES